MPAHPGSLLVEDAVESLQQESQLLVVAASEVFLPAVLDPADGGPDDTNDAVSPGGEFDRSFAAIVWINHTVQVSRTLELGQKVVDCLLGAVGRPCDLPGRAPSGPGMLEDGQVGWLQVGESSGMQLTNDVKPGHDVRPPQHGPDKRRTGVIAVVVNSVYRSIHSKPTVLRRWVMAQDVINLVFVGDSQELLHRYAEGISQFHAAGGTPPEQLVIAHSDEGLRVTLVWGDSVDHELLGHFLLERLDQLGLPRPQVSHGTLATTSWDSLTAAPTGP